MKSHFAEYQWGMKREARKEGLPISEIARIILKEFSDKSFQPTDEILPSVGGYFLEASVWNSGTIHYFIETEELHQRILRITKFVDPSMLDFLRDAGAFEGIIHTIGGTGKAVLFRVFAGGLIATDGKSVEMATNPALKIPFENLKDLFRLVFGFALYRKHFPHAIIDGFPEWAKHPSHYKGQRCFAVNVAPEIRDRAHPRFHIRRFHLRYLQDERFTKKRFTTIEVKEHEVGLGANKTVLDVT